MRYPPLRYYLERVLRDMGRVLRDMGRVSRIRPLSSSHIHVRGNGNISSDGTSAEVAPANSTDSTAAVCAWARVAEAELCRLS